MLFSAEQQSESTMFSVTQSWPTLCYILWFAAHQSPLVHGIFPPPGDLPDAGIETMSPALAGRFFTTGAAWESTYTYKCPLCFGFPFPFRSPESIIVETS